MARKISFITKEIERYIIKYFATSKIYPKPIEITENKVIFPEVLVSIFKQGEAIWTSNFFTALKQKHITDIHSQSQIYHKLVLNNFAFFASISSLTNLTTIVNLRGGREIRG